MGIKTKIAVKAKAITDGYPADRMKGKSK